MNEKKIEDMRRKYKIKEEIWIYLFFIPAILFYYIFTLKPLFGGIHASFYQWNGIDPSKEFVGLGNYMEALGDPRIHGAFIHNLIWITLSYIFQIFPALFFAVLISKITRGKTFFRTTLFLPKILSVAIVGILWGRIYDPNIGIINVLLGKIGLKSLTRAWLGDPSWVLSSVSIANAWNGYGLYMILYLAGLQNVDPVLYEAAEIDGAGEWHKFWNITLPGIRNVNFMVLILSFINSFKTFGVVWTMTQGGPFYTSEVMSTYVYKMAFVANKVGYGATVAVILGMLIIIPSAISLRLREKAR